MFFRIISLATLVVWLSEALCFPDSIPESSRKFIENENGVPIPIRIGSFRWNLAVQVSALADLLISEVLGYHVAPVEFLGFPSFEELVLKVAGCTSTECNETIDAIHIVVDSFTIEQEKTVLGSFQSKHPGRAPQDLGGMGYIFNWGIYLKGKVRDTAFREAALALEYYRNYNTTVNRPQRFFHTLSDLDMGDFLLCNSTAYGDDFTNTGLWANYVHWTGDMDGITQTPEGYVAKCPDGRFWLSTACRGNSSECIPVVATFGLVETFAQLATAHNLPFAIGRPPNFQRFQVIIRKYDLLHYWWEPDEGELADLDISRLVFPPHDASEYAVGNFRTSGEGVELKKYGSALLARFAPRVKGLVEGIATDQDAILKLSSAISLEMSEFDALGDVFFEKQDEARNQICAWAKSNREVWEPWLPIETNCFAGFGLVNRQDEPVDSRDEAVRCRICPAGTFSQFYVDDIGNTHRCVMCPPGQHQSQVGKVQCEPCDPGTFASSVGQALCSPCDRGSYAMAGGMVSCSKCGNTSDFKTTTLQIEVEVEGQTTERWIEIQGATSDSYCHCVPGRFLHNGECVLCGVGALCPGSDSLEILPGFHATSEDPKRIFQCFGSGSVGYVKRCPGGAPGSCASGRDATSPACSECLPGLQPVGAECIPCFGSDYVRLFAMAFGIIAATATLHMLFFVGGHGSNRLQSRLITAALCFSHLITFAQLFAVMRQIQAVNWADPFLSFLDFFSIFSLETLLSAVWSINCFTSLTPEASFLIRILLLPLFFAVGPSLSHICFVYVTKKPTWQASMLTGTLGSLCLLFFIMICFVCLEPFRCNTHPNGSATMQTSNSVFCDFSGQHLRLCIVGGVMLMVPLAFSALSTWIILKELPRRVSSGSTDFIRMTSFWTMRFKPGYESFTMVLLLRNMLLPFTPMLSSTSASLLVMGSLLTTSAVLVAYYQPWRSILTTQVDIIGQAVLLIVLLLSGLSVQDEDETSVMTLCTIIASLLVVVILLAAGYSMVQYVQSKFQKKFRFFLCHQKAATAALARWLKLELEGCSARFKSFIDLDSLTDLTLLFSYVSTHVQTLVILGSPGVVTRKWCVGEMVTARLSNVETVLVSLPNFSLPDETFIKGFSTRVPEIMELTTYGYGISEVKATLRWLGTVKTISMEKVSAETMSEVVDELTGTGSKINDMVLRSIGGCIVVDHEHAEALASAHILARYLAPTMMTHGMPVMVLPPETPETKLEQIQPTVVILMCPKNCLASPYIVKCVLKARFLNSSVLPVIADEDFTVPGSHLLSKGHTSSPVDADFEDAEAYKSVLAAVFLEVALPFPPRTSSEDDLSIRASQIARRLAPGALKTLRSKLWMTSGKHENDDNASPASIVSQESILAMGAENPREESEDPGRGLEENEEMIQQTF